MCEKKNFPQARFSPTASLPGNQGNRPVRLLFRWNGKAGRSRDVWAESSFRIQAAEFLPLLILLRCVTNSTVDRRNNQSIFRRGLRLGNCLLYLSQLESYLRDDLHSILFCALTFEIVGVEVREGYESEIFRRCVDVRACRAARVEGVKGAFLDAHKLPGAVAA